MKKIAVVIVMILLIAVFCSELKLAVQADNSIEEEIAESYESFSFNTLVNNFFSCVKDALIPSFPVLSCLVGMLIITAVINSFGINFDRFDIGEYVSALCFSGFLFGVIKSLCENLESYVEKLKSISAVFVPAIVSANLSDGAMTAQTSYSGAVIAIAVIEFLVYSVVLPCVKVLFVLNVVSSIVGKSVDLRGFSSSLRTFSVFSTALLMTCVVAMIHFQNVVARASDSIANRAVRFAATNLVPIVGNLLGESVKTVAHSMKAVGSITGAGGVAAVISAALPPIVACLIFKIELNLCVCVAKTLGCSAQAAVLSDTGGILNVLSGGLIVSTIGFSLMICLISNII